jgi:hypothetical protein
MANAIRYTFHNDVHDSVKNETMAEMMRSFYKSFCDVIPVRAISNIFDSYDSTVSPIVANMGLVNTFEDCTSFQFFANGGC